MTFCDFGQCVKKKVLRLGRDKLKIMLREIGSKEKDPGK